MSKLLDFYKVSPPAAVQMAPQKQERAYKREACGAAVISFLLPVLIWKKKTH